MGKNCAECNISLNKKSRSSYVRSGDAVYCKRCHRWLTKKTYVPATCSKSTPTDNNFSDNASACSNENTIRIPVNRANLQHENCIFECQDSALRRLTKEECLHIYFKTDIFVKYGSRICSSHGNGDSLQIPSNFHPYSDNALLTANDTYDLLRTFKKMYLRDTITNAGVSFLNMKNDILIFETGLNMTQFIEVIELIKTCQLPVHDKEFALGVYLSRLRRGYTFEEMAIRWNIDRKTASKYCTIVREVLKQTLVLKYLRFPQNREEALKHLTETAKIFYGPNGDKIMIIFDGTYLFIQKGADFSFQRNTYCMHKSRNLIKPMMAVYPDGYIAGVFGPYPGKKNDASIMNELLQSACWESFKAGDVLIVDRGFRDSIPYIEEKGFVAKMPSFSDSPRLPLTTEQANISRLVTKLRYQVEKVNGNVKLKCKYFNQTIQNSVVPELYDDFEIACALYNLTFTSPVQNELEKKIAYNMLERSTQKNLLQNIVKEEKLNARHSRFQAIESYEVQFPLLDLHDLHLFTCGSYQLRMAKRYLADHLSTNGDFHCQVAKETAKLDYRKYGIDIDFTNSLLLKAQIRSRHYNSVKYYVYVLLKNDFAGLQSIIGHCCGCKVGNRVNGCCSHITLIVWYFSYGRFQDIEKPGIHENDVFPTEMQSEESEVSEDEP